MKRLWKAIGLIIVLSAHPALADPEIDALRQQIKVLEARLDALERKEATQQQPPAQNAASAAPAAPAPAALPATAPAAGGTLAARVSQLEQKQEADEAQAQSAPSVAYTPGHGLSVTSTDQDFQLRMSGYVQADNRSFLDNTPSGNPSQFLLRSARPIIEATLFKDFDARLMMDFGNGQTQLLDAYGDYNAADALSVRVGKFKDPIGLERWQSEQNVLFVERGMTTNLVPYRDLGMQFFGSVIPHTLEYQIAVTDGAPDLVNITSGADSDKTITARLFAHPFYGTDISALRGFGIGVAGSTGSHDGSATNNELTTGYVTPAQTKFFTYSTSAFASGENWRINPQAMYYNGPFSLLGEYVSENEGLQSGTIQKTLNNTAWMATTTYVLTGEDASFSGVIPHENFNPHAGQWGAFELVARLSQLHVDNAAFPTFANLSTSAKEATESTVGGTWYMNPNIKLNLDFAITSFEGGAVGGDRPTEEAILSRAQFNF